MKLSLCCLSLLFPILTLAADEPLFCEKVVVKLEEPFTKGIAKLIPNGRRELNDKDYGQGLNASDKFLKNEFANLFSFTQAESNFAWYPIDFFSGGLEHPLSAKDMEGRMVLGFHDEFMATFSLAAKKQQKKSKDDYLYFGQIAKWDYLGVGRSIWEVFQDYNIDVEGPDGKINRYNCQDGIASPTCRHWTFVLGPRMPTEVVVPRILKLSNFKEVVERLLNRPATEKDFDVLQAAFELFEFLPASYKSTAVINNLKGRKVRIHMDKHYGMLAKDKSYTGEQIKTLVAVVETFLTNTARMTSNPLPRSKDSFENAPYWIEGRNKEQIKAFLPYVTTYLQEQKKLVAKTGK